MPRRPRCRRVESTPCCAVFRPVGLKEAGSLEVVLQLDELEAIRLADAEGLYHEAGAERMGVSRPTFGRILAAGRRKVALALTQGLGIRVAGGVVAAGPEFGGGHRLRCAGCAHRWSVPGEAEGGHPCPACGGAALIEGVEGAAPGSVAPLPTAVRPEATTAKQATAAADRCVRRGREKE